MKRKIIIRILAVYGILLVSSLVVYYQVSFKALDNETAVENLAKNLNYLNSELSMEIGFWSNKNHNVPETYFIEDKDEIRRTYNELVTSSTTMEEISGNYSWIKIFVDKEEVLIAGISNNKIGYLNKSKYISISDQFLEYLEATDHMGEWVEYD